MAHLQDIQLIEYCNGRLPADARAAVVAHLAACEACAEKLRQTRKTWDALGSWETGPIQADLSSRVLERVTSELADASDHGPYLFQDWVWPMAKLAASVGLAALLGHAAGLAVRSAPQGPALGAADPQQAANELYLDVLTDSEPAGFVSVILPPDNPDEEA